MSVSYRARRALIRQLAYQQDKAVSISGDERQLIPMMEKYSRDARSALEQIRPIPPDARVLEVGCGAHGLIFYFGSQNAVGVDPLAASYAKLFPAWQHRVPTVAACGESLPFADGSFDIVLCDNVVDHARSPTEILAEIARVLSPGGLLYFTVNVHHPLYAVASRLHAAWNAIGIHYEVGPFADHTMHLTLARARGLFKSSELRILEQKDNVAETKTATSHMIIFQRGDRLKRLFFKNALYSVIAMRSDDH